MKTYKSEIIEGCLAYFEFSELTGQEDFQLGLNELTEWVKKGEIKYLMVNVTDMSSAWSKEAQAVWINTGALCDQNDILKWGVVSPEVGKAYTIRYLIKGAGSKRNYKIKVSDSKEEVLEWFELQEERVNL